MISFRYHLFTIVAVFLAVALGIVFGSTYVRPGLVSSLQRQTDELRVELDRQRAEVAALTAQAELLERSGDIRALIETERLVGMGVVVVTHDGVDAELLAQARRSLDAARMDQLAVLSVTDALALEDEAQLARLAEIVGSPFETDVVRLQELAALALAQRLAVGSPRRGAQPDEMDVLDELLRESFLVTPPGSPAIAPESLEDIGGPDQVVLVIAGGPRDVELLVPPEAFLMPLVDGLVTAGAVVAAGESASTAYEFVGRLRDDGGPADGARMLTVDDLDFPIGGAALMLGLDRMLLLGEGGNYGIKGQPPDVLPLPPLP